MMQCGMFVPAEELGANLCEGLYTHHKREEDATMTSGKLDEELARMSRLVDHLTPNSMVLFNESFAATNDREDSEIARQITETLIEKRIKVLFVTHLYGFARGYWRQRREDVLFGPSERHKAGVPTSCARVSRFSPVMARTSMMRYSANGVRTERPARAIARGDDVHGDCRLLWTARWGGCGGDHDTVLSELLAGDASGSHGLPRVRECGGR